MAPMSDTAKTKSVIEVPNPVKMQSDGDPNTQPMMAIRHCVKVIL